MSRMTHTLEDLIDKEALDDALREMGPKHVKKPYRDRWTPERPTAGYCYPVAEVVYHYLAPEGSRSHVITLEEGKTHWYVQSPDGEILDLTADQPDEPYLYEKGKPRSFMTAKPSKRARILAELLGLIEPEE